MRTGFAAVFLTHALFSLDETTVVQACSLNDSNFLWKNFNYLLMKATVAL